MSDIISILGCRSDLRARLLLELAENPGKEYTEAELAKILNTSSAAVAKSLRPVAEGILKNILMTYPVFSNRVYKFGDDPTTKKLVKNIADQLKSTLNAVEKMDSSIREIYDIQTLAAKLEEARKAGKISEKEYANRLSALEKRAGAIKHE